MRFTVGGLLPSDHLLEQLALNTPVSHFGAAGFGAVMRPLAHAHDSHDGLGRYMRSIGHRMMGEAVADTLDLARSGKDALTLSSLGATGFSGGGPGSLA